MGQNWSALGGKNHALNAYSLVLKSDRVFTVTEAGASL